MKFLINRNNFWQAIQEVQRVTCGRGGIGVLQGILIETQDDHIVLTGGDKNLCIETQVNAEISAQGKVVFDSRLLGDIVRRLPDAMVEVSSIDANHIKICCNKNEITLGCQDSSSFPTLPLIKADLQVSISQKMLKKMIKGTIIATDQNGLRPIFSGVLFDLGKDRLNMVALDNSRAAIYNYMNDSIDTISVVIPGRTLSEVAKIIGPDERKVGISFTPNHILFTIDKTKVISTLLEGDFGNYDSFIPVEYASEVIVNRNDLIDCLERASVIGREGNFCAIVLEIKEDSLLISSSSQYGDIKGEIDAVTYGKSMSIKLNSKYLLEALSTLEEDDIVIRFTTSHSVFVVTNRNNADVKHIIAPVRMHSVDSM